MAHFFGGAHTEIKLEIVSAYAKAFQTALKYQPFETWYIDPFAGSGERTEKRTIGGLWEEAPVEEAEISFAGSAKRALDISPPFDHYRFADTKPEHVAALTNLRADYPDRDIQIFPGDGNECVQKIVRNRLWKGKDTGWKQRGIIFLDPYGMQVSWDSLQQIAATQRLDVWFLFAAKAVRQQLGPSLDRVDKAKAERLDRFFGEPNWRNEFFRPATSQNDFFGDGQQTAEASVNLPAIGEYARRRFEKAFCWVSAPKGLKVAHVPDYFQLYCMTNNHSAKALNLIRKLHAAVVKANEQASHHTSDH